MKINLFNKAVSFPVTKPKRVSTTKSNGIKNPEQDTFIKSNLDCLSLRQDYR